MKEVKTNTFIFLSLIIILLLIELGAAYIAYDTCSEIYSGFLYVLVILVNLIALVLFFTRLKVAAVILSVLLFGFIVPRQMFLTYKMISLQEECANITNYVYQSKLVNGEFPNSLSGYAYKFPQFKEDIVYSLREDYGFAVTYSLVYGTSHSFNHASGPQWSYYPD